MGWLGAAAAVALMVVVIAEAFAAMILPRRVKHIYFARLFFRSAWDFWHQTALLIPHGPWRQAFLGVFGPVSLLGLMTLWAGSLIVAFALLHWSIQSAITGTDGGFGLYLYFSATTFFTLGYGDLVPAGTVERILASVEAGLGYGFLAITISYLPVLYQAFSRREITISLLDARAGSPPSAGELLLRIAHGRRLTGVGTFLLEWERWAAELLESHLSYPLLSYYRSQHDNQSWVGALTCILDTSALLIAGVDGADSYQARLTFAVARHAAVDLGLVFARSPAPPTPNRLSEADQARLWASLQQAGVTLRDPQLATKALADLRAMYEPIVNALAIYFRFALPPFLPQKTPVDNWQTSPWMPRSPGLAGLAAGDPEASHFN